MENEFVFIEIFEDDKKFLDLEMQKRGIAPSYEEIIKVLIKENEQSPNTPTA